MAPTAAIQISGWYVLTMCALEGRKAQHGLHQACLRLHIGIWINLGRVLFRRVARRTPIQGESLSQVGSTHAERTQALHKGPHKGNVRWSEAIPGPGVQGPLLPLL